MGVTLSAAEQLEFLGRGHTGIITTLRRDGWPVSLPVWYAVLDGRIYVSTPPGAAKLRRVRHDDRCSFLVESGEAWVDLKAVELRARVTVLEHGPEAQAASDELWRKYDDFRPPADLLPGATTKHYADQVVLRLDPVEPMLSWDNSRIRLRSA